MNHSHPKTFVSRMNDLDQFWVGITKPPNPHWLSDQFLRLITTVLSIQMDQVIFDSDFFFFKFQNQGTFLLILLLSTISQFSPIFGHMFRIFTKKTEISKFSNFILLSHCENSTQKKTVPRTCSSLKIQRIAQHWRLSCPSEFWWANFCTAGTIV
jgi:hypothetical protein